MLKKGVTLRGIEVFEALAQSGAVAQAAKATGLSQPAVSQQMRNLEQAVGAALIDHSRRPMRLTPAGELFLRRAGLALSELRQAQTEVTVMDLAHLSELNLGIIDDFDSDLTPRLVTILGDSMKGCRFRLITDGSIELAAAVRAQDLHMAIAARTADNMEGVTEHPLARDPFIIVAPARTTDSADSLMAGAGTLPLLHYSAEQLIARQIAALLTDAGLSPPARFEIGSHPALMAMVARGMGWTITTPLGYMRATRFHEALRVMPLPVDDAARQITLFAGADWSDPVPRDIAQTMRRLMQAHMIGPATTQLPWLIDSFHLMEDPVP